MKNINLNSIAYAALFFYVFTIPWEAAIVLPGMGSIAKFVGVVAVLIVILRTLVRRRVRRWDWIHVVVLGFIAWASLTVFWAEDISETLLRITFYFQAFLMMWMVWEMTTSVKVSRILLACYVFGCYIACFSIIYDALHGSSYTVDNLVSRFSAFGTDPNETSLTLSIGVPFAWHLFTKLRGALSYLCVLYVFVAMATIPLTGSRTGFICLLLALLVVPLYARQVSARQWMWLLLGLCAGVSIMAFVVPNQEWSRIFTIGSSVSSGNLNHRTLIWAAGLRAFMQHSLFGVGAGNYSAAVMAIYGTQTVAHNTYLSILVEDGIVGFLIFFALLLRVCLFIYSAGKHEWKVWVVAFLVWGVGVATLTWDDRQVTWLLFILCASANSVLKNQGTEGRTIVPQVRLNVGGVSGDVR